MTELELKQVLRDKVLARMKELDLSFKALAYKMHIKPASLSRMLSVDRNLTVYSLYRLQNALDMKLLDI